MRRTHIRKWVGALACGVLFWMAAAPAGAQTSAPDLSRLSSSHVAADHRALAARYRAHAAEHEADAAMHTALVAEIESRAADDDTWDLARDAAHYAQHSREAAEALRDLAAHHEALADRLGTTEGEKAPSAGGCCGKKMADKKAPPSAEPKHSAH